MGFGFDRWAGVLGFIPGPVVTAPAGSSRSICLSHSDVSLSPPPPLSLALFLKISGENILGRGLETSVLAVTLEGVVVLTVGSLCTRHCPPLAGRAGGQTGGHSPPFPGYPPQGAGTTPVPARPVPRGPPPQGAAGQSARRGRGEDAESEPGARRWQGRWHRSRMAQRAHVGAEAPGELAASERPEDRLQRHLLSMRVCNT